MLTIRERIEVRKQRAALDRVARDLFDWARREDERAAAEMAERAASEAAA